jgi:type II secretory pathway component PulC
MLNLFKKNKTVILLAIAILLYSLVGIKIKTVISNSMGDQSTDKIGVESNLVKNKSFNYSLLLNYDDPFLSNGSFDEKQVTGTIQQRRVANLRTRIEKKISMDFVWPQFKLVGTVASSDKKKSLCILKLDTKKEVVLGIGDTLKGISIAEIYKDSIKLNHLKQYRIIKL